MTKFTKGPWQILPEEVDRDYIRVRGTILGGRYKVCNVLTPFYQGSHEREAVETRANAHLIAAAPDLYEELLDRYESERCGCNHPACKSCKRDQETLLVLKKARDEL